MQRKPDGSITLEGPAEMQPVLFALGWCAETQEYPDEACMTITPKHARKALARMGFEGQFYDARRIADQLGKYLLSETEGQTQVVQTDAEFAHEVDAYIAAVLATLPEEPIELDLTGVDVGAPLAMPNLADVA
jgi:hypothetical protein